MRLSKGKDTIKMPKGVYEILSVDVVTKRSKHNEIRNCYMLMNVMPNMVPDFTVLKRCNGPQYFTAVFRDTHMEIKIYPAPKKQTDVVIRYTETKVM